MKGLVAVTAAVAYLGVVHLGFEVNALRDRVAELEKQRPAAAVVVEQPRPVATPRADRSRPLPRTRLQVTAYCWTGNRTASGAWPATGHAATLDRSIPFGTRFQVPGVGIVTVTDRAGHSTDLDVYMGRNGCEERARQFGRRTLTVTEVRP